MKNLFFIISTFIVGITFCNAQTDTIRIQTDSGVVLVVKKPPVRIKKVIEVLKERLDGHIYLSVNIGILGDITERKVQNSLYNEYFQLSKENTHNKIGYSQSFELIRAPRNWVWIMHFDWCRLNEKYKFFYGVGKGTVVDHRYNFARYGLRGGYWFNKGKQHSLLPNAGFSFDYLTSNAGSIVGVRHYVYDKDGEDPAYYSYLFWDFKTRQFFPSVHVNVKYLYKVKNTYIEMTPFFTTNLMNLMQDREVFKEDRWIYGVRLGFVQNIF